MNKERPLSINYYSTYLRGGAGATARSLCESFLEKEYQIRCYTQDSLKLPYLRRMPVIQPSQLSRVKRKVIKTSALKDLRDLIEHRPRGYENFIPADKFENTPYRYDSQEKPDLIHLHWVNHLLDYPSFFASVPEDLPIVWSIHDCYPFTSGCSYPWDCEQFKFVCKKCPQLNPNVSHKLVKRSFFRKSEAYRGKRIIAVANSEWTREQIQSSAMFHEISTVEKIYWGVDLQVFKPRNVLFSRSILGIPEDHLVIAFGADKLANNRKGYQYVSESIKCLQEKNIKVYCLIFGRDTGIQQFIPGKSFGEVNSPELLSLIYSAADIFIMPSIHEALGLTAIESMACGTPVIAFNVGGIKETIIHGETGYLLDKIASDEIVESIISLNKDKSKLLSMSQASRLHAIKNFNWDFTVARYEKLYCEVIQKKLY